MGAVWEAMRRAGGRGLTAILEAATMDNDDDENKTKRCYCDSARFAVRVRVFPYPETAVAVWVLLSVTYKRNEGTVMVDTTKRDSRERDSIKAGKVQRGRGRVKGRFTKTRNGRGRGKRRARG